MNCNEYSKLMTDLLAGEISEKDKATLEAHIAACDSCRKEFGELQNVWKLTESALKCDFFDDSLKPDNYRKILEKVKPVKQAESSKKSKPIKFVWMEIAASVIVFLFFAALLLPALMPAGVKARRISVKSNMQEIGLLPEALHDKAPSAPAKKQDHYMVHLEESKVAIEGAPGSASAFALPEPVSKSEVAVGKELSKGIREEAETSRKRSGGTRGLGAKDSDRDSSVTDETSKEKYGKVVYADGHVQGKTAEWAAAGVAGEKLNERQITVESKREYKKQADKKLSDDYKYAEVAAAERPAAPPVALSPVVTTGSVPAAPAGTPATSSGYFAAAQAASPAPSVTTAPAKAPVSKLADTAKKPLSEEALKREAYLGDFRRKADSSTKDLPVPPAEPAVQLAYDRVDALKASDEEAKAERKVIKAKEADALVSKNYTLNLKLWDLTDVKTAREFLKRKGADFADSAEISINKDANTITLKTTKENLERADDLFSELRKAEDSLKEMKNGLPFIPTRQKPFSTFSIDVDTASYTMARKLLRNGQKPESFSVRPEEFINYFDYHYRSPVNSTFAVYLEAAPSVFRPEDYTLRVGVKAREIGPDGSRPSVFTILIDASGSMARESRMDLVKRTIPLLFDQMRPDDKVAVFTCTHRTINIVDYMPVKDKKTIVKLIEGIMPAGVADIEKGLVTAYDSALKHYMSGAYNRVILMTDGISNIGSHSAELILSKVSAARKMGVTNTVVALGGDGDDKFLEAIANKGDGNYVYIENEESARELFVNEFAGRFREIARDVKIQVEFNPAIVAQYRQVGYENRQLSKADFRNDKVDAGEVGAGQSVTALYEMKLNKAIPAVEGGSAIESSPNYVCVVRVRYRRADNLDVEEREFPMALHELKANFAMASCGFRLAASVAEFAEFLRYPDIPGIANPENVMGQVKAVLGEDYRNDGKVSELYSLMRNVK